MPAFSVSAPHSLGRQSATERLHGVMGKVQQKYPNQVSDLEESWDENVMSFAFTTYGFRIKGQAQVDDDQVRLDGELPFAAMMFRGRIEQSIQDELVKMLS